MGFDRRSRQTLLYIAIFLLLLQFGLPYAIPTRWIHHYRVDYETTKPYPATDYDVAVERIAREVRGLNPDDYVILLGDSVMYSGPFGPTESIGYYLEQWSRAQGHPWRVFNLAQPAMQNGDYYTVLLMLKAHGVPLSRVVINETYFGFPERTPDVPAVSRLGYELQRRDPETFGRIQANLSKRFPPKHWTKVVRETALRNFELWRHRDYLRGQLNKVVPIAPTQEVMDPRPWDQKPWLRELMKEPSYQRFVDPKPFDMTSNNPNVLFLERIVELTEGGHVLFVFTPVNQALMAEWVANDNYQANLKRVDAWFAQQPADYINLESTLPADQFVDHVHLLASGYRQVAEMIGRRLVDRQYHP